VRLGKERYGMETRYIQEVSPLKECAFVPGAPAFLLGFINVRSRILALLDLKVFFNIPVEQGSATKAVIVSGEGREFAIAVDEVLTICNLEWQQVQALPHALTGAKGEFLLGIGPQQTAILDGKKMLLSRNLVVDVGL
jgi:purine-binding chemotaxis protein CheW